MKEKTNNTRGKLRSIKDMFENYASSDKVTRYMTWETHSNIDVTKEKINKLQGK